MVITKKDKPALLRDVMKDWKFVKHRESGTYGAIVGGVFGVEDSPDSIVCRTSMRPNDLKRWPISELSHIEEAHFEYGAERQFVTDHFDHEDFWKVIDYYSAQDWTVAEQGRFVDMVFDDMYAMRELDEIMEVIEEEEEEKETLPVKYISKVSDKQKLIQLLDAYGKKEQ